MNKKITDFFTISHEFGDINSFANPEESRFLRSNSTYSNDRYNVSLDTGSATVSNSISIDEFCLSLNSEVNAAIDSALDVVLARIVFNNKVFKHIIYKDLVYQHNNKNIYNYVDDFSNIKDNDSISLSFSTHDSNNIEFLVSIKCLFISINKNWNLRLYLRDERDKWIVHLRLMPNQGYIATKNCTSWYNTKAVPKLINNFLNKFDLGKSLLYRAEINPSGPITRRLINLCSYYIYPINVNAKLEVNINRSFE